MRHMGRAPFTRDESAASLKSHLRHWEKHGFGLWAVEERTSGMLIGRAGVAFHRAWPHDPEVGWLIDTAWQGLGLATEVGTACVDFGFEQLGTERLVSICTPENGASRRVMAKLGFHLLEELDDPLLGIRLWIHALERESPR